MLETSITLISDLVFVAMSRSGSQTSFLTGITIGELGGIPRLIYLLIIPAVIFPTLLGVRRGLVVRATILSVLTFGLGGLWIGQMMMESGLILYGPGL